MSSKSFSSYEYSDEDCYSHMLLDNYGRIIETVPPGACYHTMAQPLIYYAQVLPSDIRQSRGQKQRKVNQSYFVKAFKWYTQDRPPENKNIRSAELREFASWLDAKYSEYLREIETDQPENCLQTHKTSAYGAMGKEYCRTNESCTTKRFARMKCPWKKHKGKDKNDGDEPSKMSDVSCKFILQPKDLTRPASKCCHTTLAICPNAINTTEAKTINKLIRKSQSMTSVCRERAIQDCIDIMIAGPTSKDVAKKLVYCPEMCKCVSKILQQHQLSIPKQEQETETQIQQETSRLPKYFPKQKNIATGSKNLQAASKPHNVNHEGQYLKLTSVHKESTLYDGPRETLISTDNTTNTLLCKCPVDAEQQYDPTQGKSCKSSNKSDSTVNSKPNISSKVSTVPLTKCCVACQCSEDVIKVDASTQYNNDFESFDNFMNKSLKPGNTKTECTDQDMNFKARELHSVEKVTGSLSIFNNSGMQTSDHSISIVTGDGPEFPLFMKVICADKFNSYRCC